MPLIAALRSPVFGFDGDKLAFLRAGAKGDFYTAVAEAAGRGDQACRDFLEQLEELRFGAGERTCRQLIWHIYEKTNLLGLFGAMPGGQERQDNLLALYALAGQLEDSGCRSRGPSCLLPAPDGRERGSPSCLSTAPRGWKSRWCWCAACPGG